MIGKMPGDPWQKFANLRLLYGYMFGHPGKKLLFMGGEFGQWAEWDHDRSLDWHLLQYPLHSGLERWVGDLNAFYRSEPAMYELDAEPAGFEWIDCDDGQNSCVSLLRFGRRRELPVAVVCNFTPVPRHDYRIGVPSGGVWVEALNSDASVYGGSGMGNLGRIEASPHGMHGRPCSLGLTLPPLSTLVLRREGR
jgi:1,4-alpha-glucan branching enzyme